jgi:hypothetical protein
LADEIVPPPRETLCELAPELIITVTTEPSAFLKAATWVLGGAPEVAIRTASGLM